LSPTVTATPCASTPFAHVYDGIENDKSPFWFNGERAISLSVQKQPGTNVVAGRRRGEGAAAGVPRAAAAVDHARHPQRPVDRHPRIGARDIKITLLLTIALAVLVIFLFLRNISATIIPSLTLPVSLVATFRGDVRAELQPRQPVAVGAHPVGRLHRRQHDRHPRETSFDTWN
jgi:HAE1 family hydrophobic/amphiphilic exporter-1